MGLEEEIKKMDNAGENLRDRLISLKDVLEGILRFRIGLWVYLPGDVEWSLISVAAVLEDDEVPLENENDPEAGVPEFAKRNELKRALPVSVVRGIVHNAREQNEAVTMEDLFDAFMFYYENDAYIDFAGR